MGVKKHPGSISILGSAVSMPVSVAAKIGSIVVHADEYTSSDGHHADLAAIRALLADKEVAQFLLILGPLVPKKRNP